ncbi:MAG: hypothetical protein JJE25_05190 [Bacteroidia bacterium]|nr:hypothetical protein [Bacteroidia bacterium]
MNQLTLQFSSKECDIYYNESLKAIQTKWKGIYIKDEGFRTILNEIIKALQEKKVSTIIADAREMKIIADADRLWIIDDWYPHALEAGFRCQALIVSRDSFNEQALKLIVMKYNDELVKTRYFIAPDDAEEWVRGGAPQ